MLSRSIEIQISKILALVGVGASLVACAGPTTPFGGLNPWDLHQSGPVSVEASNESEFGLGLGTAKTPTPLDAWSVRKSQQDNSQPWVLMDPEQINYVAPTNLKIYIHDPNSNGRRPWIRLTYDDWDMTSKIRDRKNWQKISETDWQFTSAQIKFSPARVGELKVSFYSRQNSRWVSSKLQEPQCQFVAETTDARIQQTGRFQVDPSMIKKIQTHASSQQVNPNLIAGLIAQESGFNTRAVSTSKAIGLTQVTPVAEKEILNIHPEFPQYPGLNRYSFVRLLTLVNLEKIGPSEEWRLDPDESISGGITYLEMVRDYWERFSKERSKKRIPASLSQTPKPLTEQEQMMLTLASYNSGPSRVKHAYLQNPKMWMKDDSLREARTYVHKISSYCSNFSKPVKTAAEGN